MEKFEQFMMKASRVFSLIAMSFLFLIIAIVIIVMGLGYASEFLKPSIPNVDFDKSQFTETKAARPSNIS